MIDMTKTVEPKSDQLNADDLIASDRTITVREVRATGTGDQQPISIFYQDDNGKPYKPCKSMRRVLVKAWGADGSQYAGRSMTLFCDPSVSFGGQQVGGIRISHLSHIESDFNIALTVSRAQRKGYHVKRLSIDVPEELNDDEVTALLEGLGKEATAAGLEAYQRWFVSNTESARDKMLGHKQHETNKMLAREVDEANSFPGDQ